MDSPIRRAVYFSSATKWSQQNVHFLQCKTLEVGFSRQEMHLRSFLFFSFFLLIFYRPWLLKGAVYGQCKFIVLILPFKLLSPLWNLTLVTKSLVINKITAPSPANMPPKHYIKRNNKNELWKTVWLTSFHKSQLQSVLIFFKFVHLNLLLCFFVPFIQFSGSCYCLKIGKFRAKAPLTLKALWVTNINLLLTISIHNQKKRLWDVQSRQVKRTPQDSINELIIWKMNALVVPVTSVKFKSAFLHA